MVKATSSTPSRSKARLRRERHAPLRPGKRSIRVACWLGGRLTEGEGPEAVRAAIGRRGATTWVDLASANADDVRAIARILGLHELIAEDILEGNQRAKIEVTDRLIHIVMFALENPEAGRQVVPSEIDIVLGKGFLLTVHESDFDPRASNHLRDGLGVVMAHGADHLLWAIVDTIVDNYFPFLDRLGDAIEEISDSVIDAPSKDTLEGLFRLKGELLAVRRAANPVREIFNQLTNRDLALIDANEILYFRDVYDHLIRLTDELDGYRELVSGTLEIYLSTVNNNLSLIMKRLTGVTVVLTGIAAIAGIFGMSEAGTALGGGEAAGFWLVTVLTVAAALAMAGVLRRIGWI